MHSIAIAVWIASQLPPSADWISLHFTFPDNDCAFSHDRLSGAYLTTCSSESLQHESDSLKRQFESHTISLGKTELIVREYADPNFDLDRLRSTLEDDELDCWTRAYLAALQVPEQCAREVAYVAPGPNGTTTVYSLKSCSANQEARVLDFLSALDRGEAPQTVSRGTQPSRPIPREALERIANGWTFQDVVSSYGPPFQMWPDFPDGFKLLYPLQEESQHEVVVTFDRERNVTHASILCEGVQSPGE
jgi:hypothetical protein